MLPILFWSIFHIFAVNFWNGQASVVESLGITGTDYDFQIMISIYSPATDPDEYMMSQVISPLNELHSTPKQVVYLLIDGLDECKFCTKINKTLFVWSYSVL